MIEAKPQDCNTVWAEWGKPQEVRHASCFKYCWRVKYNEHSKLPMWDVEHGSQENTDDIDKNEVDQSLI